MNQLQDKAAAIANELSKSRRLKNTTLLYGAKGIAISGGNLGCFLIGKRFLIKWSARDWSRVKVALEFDPALSWASIAKAAHEYEIGYKNGPIVGLSVPSDAPDIEDALFILDQVGVVAQSNEACMRGNVSCTDFDLIGFAAERGYALSAEDLYFDELWDYEEPNCPILAPYAIPYNLALLEESMHLTHDLEQLIWNDLGYLNLGSRRWLFGREILDSLSRRGYSQAQVDHLITWDYELFAGPKNRLQTQELCSRIERSPFDPENEEHWNNFLSCEDEPLLGFL